MSRSRRRSETQQIAASESNVEPPPLPERQNQPETNNAEAPIPVLPDQAPLPPLPPAAAADVPPIPGAAPENQQAEGNDDAGAEAPADGRFVANAEIDEGVQIVEKFLHGTSVEERMAAPGTRSRRAAVKVLSVARCPLGGHFATGAGDGICRVWEDAEDIDVEIVDNRTCRSAFDWSGGPALSSKEEPKRRSCKSTSVHT